MRGGRSFGIAGFVLLVLLVGGCSSEAPSTPAAPAPTAASPTPTATPEPTEAPDPYAIPDDPADIDEKYVERVLEALNESLVEATRIVATEGRVTAAARRALTATHLPEAQEGYLRAYREFLDPDGPGIKFRRDPRPIEIVAVNEVISSSAECVFVLARQDSSGLIKGTAPPFPVYYHLEAKQNPTPDPGNPTPWMIARDAEPPPNNAEYEDPCAGS